MATATDTVTTVEAPPASKPAPIMTHKQIMLVIYGLMSGMFLSSLAQTVFGTAIRTIGDDLHGLDQQAWVTTAFLITSTIAVPIYGKLSDIFGRRPLFILGIVVFILGSTLSAFSTSMMMLAAFRAFQGIGAGALMALPLAIMGDILAPRERAKYQGYFFAVFGIATVIGPLVGGLFAGAKEILWIDGWRWTFLINIPLGLFALFMVITFLHLPKVGKHKGPRIDWWGAAAVIVALVPLLIVVEQGRTWGWDSVASISCYLIGGLGLVAFIVIEALMKDDAIIPLKLFRSGTFSMATVLGFLVGFAMFGAMMTIPLYMQIVVGMNPTESGLSMLPLIVGLMIASLASGQITARTGKYRIFPVLGTLFTAVGFFSLTLIRYETPLWQIFVGMFVLGLGLGQLMQPLTLASQNSVDPHEMGVASSAATFFRQIGGTLGTAVMLSVLFSMLPANILHATEDKANLTAALDTALDPAQAGKAENAAIMKQQWSPIVGPLTKNIQAQLDKGVAEGDAKAKAAADEAVTAAVTAGVDQAVAAGQLPAAAAPAVIAEKVAEATPAAEAAAHEKVLTAVAEKAHATVNGDTVSVDWADRAQRTYWVDQLVPTLQDEIKKKADDASGSSSTSVNDTSFLTGADATLSKPFMIGFIQGLVTLYWVGLGVILLAFVLTWFFKVPPLRARSALQEQADKAGLTETGTIRTHSA
ncbi:Multidrug resistance protein 3 [Microbacterium azadirachtae]|uniref:Multidrug resistance protein 3 n=1 Tax=Microbacterium azadirachtae TaxID=582680 RepID=A0A0F0KXI7_9MICO|nr:MDR family MFS transporter [Microbacterium azadirachtae]KJL25184.1 Multidrug resistance protein 3 [Microbacterium azadirachtae]